MNALFDKFLNDELSDDEAAELTALLQDEENGRELVRYIAETQAIVAVGRKVARSNPQPKKRPFKLLPVIIAAAALITLGLFVFYPEQAELWVAETKESYLQQNEIKTPLNNLDSLKDGDVVIANEKTELQFKDKSRLILHSGSRLRVKSVLNKRIFLELGTVHIFTSVQKEKGGLVCETDDLTATAMGTEFSVHKMERSTFVKVHESKVKVVKDSEEQVISEGMEAVADSNSLKSSSQEGYAYYRWENWSKNFRQDPDIALYLYSTSAVVETQEFRGPQYNGTLTSGRWPQNRAFRGRISYPSSTDFNSQELTFFTWFKLHQRGDHPPLITKGDNSWRLQLGGKGIYLDLSDGHLRDDSPVAGKTSLKLNRWYLACGVFTKTGLKLYLDGELEGESISQNRNYNNFPVVIGGNPEIGRVFKGAISEAGIVRRALSAAEIKLMFLSGRTAD